MIDCSVHVAPLPCDLHIGVIHGPAISYSVPAGPGDLGQQRREPLHPPVDSDVVDLDPSFSEQLLDVAVRQSEAQVPADREDDDVWWEAEAREGGPRGQSRARAAGSHAGSLAARTRSRPMQQCQPAARRELDQVGPAGLAQPSIQPGNRGQAENGQRPQRPRQPGRPQRVRATRTAAVTAISLAACGLSSSPPASSAVDQVAGSLSSVLGALRTPHGSTVASPPQQQ
jgi:hypothetical protein